MLLLLITLSLYFIGGEATTGWGKPDPVEILLWSGGSWAGFTHGDHFPAPNYLGHSVDKTKWNCPVECKYTVDKNRAGNVDAVVFEGQPLTGYFDDYKRAPPQMPPKFGDQMWVNYGYETPVYFNIYGDHGYMDFIDVNFTYYMHSQVPITFTCLWGGGEREDFLKPPPPKSKDKCAAFMATNCGSGGATYRTAYVKELMEHMKLDSLGQCLHNADLPKEMQFPIYSDHGSSMRNKIAIFKDYKFVLCFENNNITDYVTEKLPNVLQAGSVPVYMGADNVHPFWTPGEHSIVETRNFKGPKDLAQYLTKMCEEDDEYAKFFEWKKKGLSDHFNKRIDECVFYGAECRLCEHIAKERKKLSAKNVETIFERKKGQHAYNFIELTGGNYLEVKHRSELELTTQMTLSAWIKISKLDVPIIDAKHYKLSIKTVWKRGYVELCVKDVCYMGSHPIVLDSWYHIAVTFKHEENDNDFVKFFVNGVVDDVIEIPTIHPLKEDYQTESLLIGTDQQISNLFVGNLDDVSIWDIALDDEKARRLVLTIMSGIEDGLVAFFSFNQAQTKELTSVGRVPMKAIDGTSVKFHEGLTKPLVTVNPCL